MVCHRELISTTGSNIVSLLEYVSVLHAQAHLMTKTVPVSEKNVITNKGDA